MSVDRAGAHVDDPVDLSERALPQKVFVDVDGTLSGSVRLAGRHLGRAAGDAQAAEGRVGSLTATVIEELRHILFILSLACPVAGKYDFEAEPPNVYFNLPLLCFPSLLCMLLQVQNLGEVMPHFFLCLAVITHRGSVGRGISQHKTSFFVDHVEQNMKVDPADAPYASGSQSDIAFLLVGAESIAFTKIFRRLFEVQQKTIHVFIIISAIVFLRYSVCGRDLSTGNDRVVVEPFSRR